MFIKEEGLPDSLKDEVCKITRRLVSRVIWNDEAKQSKAQLIELLERKGYISFTASTTNYGCWQIGESLLYWVPADRRGPMSEFKEQTVRLVCTGSGRYTRTLMVGPVRVTKETKSELQSSVLVSQSSIKSELLRQQPFIGVYAKMLGIKTSNRDDGLRLLAAKESSSMVSTWTDVLALEKTTEGLWRLHNGGFEILGRIYSLEGVTVKYGDDGQVIAPKKYQGQKVLGLADGEYLIVDRFYSEEQSPPFEYHQMPIWREFLKEHGWIDDKDGLHTLHELTLATEE